MTEFYGTDPASGTMVPPSTNEPASNWAALCRPDVRFVPKQTFAKRRRKNRELRVSTRRYLQRSAV